MEWSWQRRQEVTGVATEEESGRREGDAQRRREHSVSLKLQGGNMSGLPSESLRKGGPKCPYFPFCEAQHGALQCVRLALLTEEHRDAIDIARKVCLHCHEQEVDADGACGQCRSTRALASEPRPSVAQWPRPDWTVVPEAKTDQDFYECIALSEVARFNLGPIGQ